MDKASIVVRAKALLAGLRTPNAPSVISNLTTGFALGWFLWGGGPSFESALGWLALSGLSLFFAGNLANDWFDRRWDATHRPERALPSRLFQPASYLVAALLLTTIGMIAAAQLGGKVLATAAGLLGFILLYTAIHKRTRLAVIPMGLCRACLYLMGFLACWPSLTPEDLETVEFASYTGISPDQILLQEKLKAMAFIGTHALGLLVYIAGLSLAARYESIDHPPHGMVLLSRAMLLLPLAAMSAWWMPWWPLAGILGMIPFAIWLALSLTRYRSPIPVLVSALLAGIPLIDFIAAVPLVTSLSKIDQSILEQPLLLITVSTPIIAFIFGRLLQRLAPAT